MQRKLFCLGIVVACSIALSLPVSHLAAQDDAALPLAEYGPYGVGRITLAFEDENHQGQQLMVEVWYPATLAQGEEVTPGGLRDAKPDIGDAPYPLVLATHPYGGGRYQWAHLGVGDSAGHLASHGFVVAAPDHTVRSDPWLHLISRSLDLRLVLNQLAENPEGDLVGMIDSSRVGVWAWGRAAEFGALVMSGAWVDPTYLSSWCAESAQERTVYDPCALTEHWDEFSAALAQLDQELGTSWPILHDKRIAAVVMVAPWGAPLFGEDGLAAVTVPTLILAPTSDTIAPYERDAAFIYNHVGAQDRLLLSFVDWSEGTFVAGENPRYFRHFSTAFFGRYLQDREDYADILTEDYVQQFGDVIAWGVVDLPAED